MSQSLCVVFMMLIFAAAPLVGSCQTALPHVLEKKTSNYVALGDSPTFGEKASGGNMGVFIKTLALMGIASLMLSLTACTRPDRLSAFSYLHRPLGYTWAASINPTSGKTDFHTRDPRTGRTLYLVSDGRYYTLSHSGTPTTKDFQWIPRNADGS